MSWANNASVKRPRAPEPQADELERSPVNPDGMALTSRLPAGALPCCIQIKRCFGSAGVYLHVLTGDLPVTLRSTILEAPSRLELGGSFLRISGADSFEDGPRDDSNVVNYQRNLFSTMNAQMNTSPREWVLHPHKGGATPDGR
jgi:hypothetical protein